MSPLPFASADRGLGRPCNTLSSYGPIHPRSAQASNRYARPACSLATIRACLLSNALSSYLKTVKAVSQGLYTEIFVMDNKGLNVGQSDVTSDYWQGDEAKWKKTYKVGPQAMHIGKVKTDESTQTLQSQLSLSIADPDSGQVIGAVTVGVNVEQLGQ